jgi:hypothetical protein
MDARQTLELRPQIFMDLRAGESQIGAWATPTATDRPPELDMDRAIPGAGKRLVVERAMAQEAARSEAINERPVGRAWPSCESSVRLVPVADAKQNKQTPRAAQKRKIAAPAETVS